MFEYILGLVCVAVAAFFVGAAYTDKLIRRWNFRQSIGSSLQGIVSEHSKSSTARVVMTYRAGRLDLAAHFEEGNDEWWMSTSVMDEELYDRGDESIRAGLQVLHAAVLRRHVAN